MCVCVDINEGMCGAEEEEPTHESDSSSKHSFQLGRPTAASGGNMRGDGV